MKKDGVFQIDDVADWSDIVAISAETNHIVGLKADGTVVAAFLSDDPDNDHGQCDVSDWTDIVAISTGLGFTVGVKKDGTIVSAGDVFGMSKWKLFNNIDTLEEEISEARELRKQREEQSRREAEQKRAEAIDALKQEITAASTKTQALETELANLKGLFNRKRRKELEEQIDASYKKIRELQTKLNKMQ